MGDRLRYLQTAVAAVDARVGRILATSPSWETTPVGPCEGLFLNAALLCESFLEPELAMAELLSIEADMGRIRGERWGSRIIDLDLLLAQDEGGHPVILQSEALTVPHPLMLKRDFVLIPAAAIAGDWLHPVSDTSLSQALAQLLETSPMTALRVFSPSEGTTYSSSSASSCARPMVN